MSVGTVTFKCGNMNFVITLKSWILSYSFSDIHTGFNESRSRRNTNVYSYVYRCILWCEELQVSKDLPISLVDHSEIQRAVRSTEIVD